VGFTKDADIGDKMSYFKDLDFEILNKIVERRRSIRSFKKNEKIRDEDIKRILNNANKAPSARNIHPLEFVLVTDPKLKEELDEVCNQKQPSQASINIIVIGDLELAGKVGEISPHEITTSEKGKTFFIYLDAAAAIQNILLTATSLKIDSLWIGSFDEKKVSEMLNLPEKYVPLSVICLGKRYKEPSKIPQREIQDRIYLNKFSENKHDLSYLEASKRINPIEDFKQK